MRFSARTCRPAACGLRPAAGSAAVGPGVPLRCDDAAGRKPSSKPVKNCRHSGSTESGSAAHCSYKDSMYSPCQPLTEARALVCGGSMSLAEPWEGSGEGGVMAENLV